MRDTTSHIGPTEPFARMDEDIVIRTSTEEDANALDRLAELDGTHYSGGDVLLAESGSEVVAAVPVDGTDPFADPFTHTANIVAMLEVRRDQLAECAKDGVTQETAVRRARRVARRPRRYRGPVST